MKEFRKPEAKFNTTDNNMVIATLYYHHKKYVGKAKCAPEDTFDYEFGKKLAYDRALKKWFKAKKSFLEEKCFQYQRTIDLLEVEKRELKKKYIDICNEYDKYFED